jgi:dTDP-4-dehydrorhamnose reductase
MRVIVIGSRGQLGAAVVHEFSPHHEVVPFDHAALDITDHRRVGEEIERVKPDVIINCAAYNAVDDAEDHPVEALQINAFAVRSLARAAVSVGAALVQYSSDFVFDGKTTRPYVEDDPPNPLSVYAISKMLGEWFAADVPRAYVLRVESLFGRAPDGRPVKGSVAAIVKGLQHGDPVTVFADRTVSPTFVIDGARATRAIIDSGIPPGTYHCVNTGCCTWFEFAQEAARILGVEPRIEPVRLKDVTFRAARPSYCALSNQKLASAGVAMPAWQDALARYLRS